MGLTGALGCPKGQIAIKNITNWRTTPRNSFCSKLYLFQQEKQRKWPYFTALNRITLSVHNMVKRTLKILHQMLQWMLSIFVFYLVFLVFRVCKFNIIMILIIITAYTYLSKSKIRTKFKINNKDTRTMSMTSFSRF